MGRTDIVGTRFGRLTVQCRTGTRNKQPEYRVRCDCGVEKSVLSGNLTSGRTVSCGCLLAQRRRERAGSYMTSSPTYISAHCRIYTLRGAASSYSCEGCGGSAEQWAYDHKDPAALETEWKDQKGKVRRISYSGNPGHYLALCRRCHVAYDKGGKND